MTSETPEKPENIPDFSFILRLVKRILPNGYDHESIAGDLVLRGLEQGTPPSFSTIRNYCISQTRRQRVELQAREAIAGGRLQRTILPEDVGGEPFSLVDTISHLFEHAGITPECRQILIHKFYFGRSDLEISSSLDIPVYRVTELRNEALNKLRIKANELYPRKDEQS